jgi:hypothetical protein
MCLMNATSCLLLYCVTQPQDTLDAIAHIRSKVGSTVPMVGVAFSFGGALLTTTVGSVPKEQHTLSAVVSVSGLFDFGVSALLQCAELAHIIRVHV